MNTTEYSLKPLLWDSYFDLDKLNDALEAEPLEHIAWQFYTIYLWVICAIGLPANIVVIITIVGMKVLSPATIFVTLLAFCDGLALLSKLIGQQLVVHKVSQGPILCKLEFIPNYFSTLANWALILICVERFISVCYPLKKVYLLTKKRCFIAAAILSGVLLAFFAILFFVMRTDVPKLYMCGTLTKYVKFWRTWWYWIGSSLYLFIPFLLIIGFTIPIIRGLFMSRRQRRSMVLKKTSSGNHTESDLRLLKETERTERMITIMLIVAGIVFLVLCLPACVYFLMSRPPPTEKLATARHELFKQVAYLLADLSHAVNFFLYFFTAKRFRSFAYKIFCPCCYNRNLFPKFFGTSRVKAENNSAASRDTQSTKINMLPESQA